MRQIRHIVPGIYHREIKKASNYIRRTNGNKNRNSSIRTTYSSGGSSTSVPNNKEDKSIEVEDSKDDTVFTIDSSYLVDGKFEMLVSGAGYIPSEFQNIFLGGKDGYIDWGDGKVERFVNILMDNTSDESEIERLYLKQHIYKEKKKYKIKVHHKGFPLKIGNKVFTNDDSIEEANEAISVAESIISFEQIGLVISHYPSFNVVGGGEGGALVVKEMANLQEIPPLPLPFVFKNPSESSGPGLPGNNGDYVTLYSQESSILFGYIKCGLIKLPSGFFNDIVSGLKKYPKVKLHFYGIFGNTKLETLPEDLFKPFTDFSVGKQASFEYMFASCLIKDKFPPKYQPLDWKTEEGQEQWRGIFARCKTIPNYDDIPPILRSE